MYEVVFSKSFKKSLNMFIKKNPQLEQKIRKQIKILKRNPHHPSLRLHKLAGQNSWSMTINMDTRIIFTIVDNLIVCTTIGSHDEVYN